MFKPEGFSKQIFKDRYAFNESETWEEACIRVANQMAMAELPNKVEKYKNKFYDILLNNYFCPGGRIWYNSGRPNPQLLNCFVLMNDLDSKEGWAGLIHDNIITSMSGGGCGQDFSDIRPNGAEINGQRGICPGPIELMKAVNSAARAVRSGGSRRSANMFSLNLHHPDILKFLNSKLKQGELEMANISVRSKYTEKFINAVKNNLDWELSWKGRYKNKIKARDLWDTIVNNAYDCAEPGFLNLELALNESTVYYIEELVTTNPCGEILLSPNDCCCLGHLVLTRFVKNNKIDWTLLGEVIRSAVRFLDNVLTVNHYPMLKMKEQSHKLRRIGLGTTGLADMLAMLNMEYGSEEGNKFIDKLYRTISKEAYESSIMLSIEKGPFPECKPDLHIKSGYVKRMTKKVKDLIEDHGIRNCALLAQAPTGTVSILSNNCSSGIEPMFAFAYWRNYWDNDERKRELCFHPLFIEFMEKNKSVDHFMASHNLTVKDHMEVQKIIQKHVDNAVSKTVNIPKNYNKSKLADLWLEYLPYLKGTTFFREGSRMFLDKDGNPLEPPLVPINLKKAIELYKKEKQIISKTTTDCPKGICEI
jgi:ribonucleoside-diphosphate reductase alpha chain